MCKIIARPYYSVLAASSSRELIDAYPKVYNGKNMVNDAGSRYYKVGITGIKLEFRMVEEKGVDFNDQLVPIFRGLYL